MEESKFNEFYRNWRSKLPELAESYIFDENKKLNPTRYIFSLFRKKIEQFLTDKLEEVDKIIILPGIRGAGKTTLLMQLFMIEKFLRSNDINLLSNLNRLNERLYIDVSKLKMEGISLNEFFKFYEKAKGFNVISLKEKYLLLLDEVHYDDNWGLFLKSIFDSTKGHKNILVIATGSSSIHLKMNPDLSRRVRVEEIFPMKFNEYLIIKYNKLPIAGLSDELQNIIFDSKDAKEVYEGLHAKSRDISSFFIDTPLYAEDDFFEIGGFPYSVRVVNKIRALELVKNVINNIIVKDIIGFEQFKTQSVAKLNQ
ncbi:MAG: AAA family ATPase [candidate division WOR-3 bacterium]